MRYRMRLVSPEEWQRLAGGQCLVERLTLKTGAGPIDYDGIPEGEGVYAVADAWPEAQGVVMEIEDGELRGWSRPAREVVRAGVLRLEARQSNSSPANVIELDNV